MSGLRVIETTTIYRDQHSYSSHPWIARLDGGAWLLTFSQSTRQNVGIHPSSDPRFVNLVIRSDDEGRSWNEPRVAPGYDWYGTEVAGIAQISNGDVLLNQLRWIFAPTEEAHRQWERGDRRWYVAERGWFPWRPKRLQQQDQPWNERAHDWHVATKEADWNNHVFPFARREDGAYVQVSHDLGATWDESVAIDISPYVSAYSRPGAVELANGDLLLAMMSHDWDPVGASFVVRSRDRGLTWTAPVEVARVDGLRFTEPSVVETSSGKLILMSREDVTGYIHQSDSLDGGVTWAAPEQISIWGSPPHIVRLRDDSLFMVYGYRREQFGIRGTVSVDDGVTWCPEIVIRDDLTGLDGGSNMGYPSVIEYAPGKLFVAYYAQDGEGVTHIQGTYLEVIDRVDR